MSSHHFFKHLLDPSQAETFNNLTRSPISTPPGFGQSGTEPFTVAHGIGFPAYLIPESGAWPAYTTHISQHVRRMVAEDQLRYTKSQAALEEHRLQTCSGESGRGHTPGTKHADAPEDADSAESTAEVPETGVNHKPLFLTPGSSRNAEGLISGSGLSWEPSCSYGRVLFCRKKPIKVIGGRNIWLQNPETAKKERDL